VLGERCQAVRKQEMQLDLSLQGRKQSAIACELLIERKRKVRGILN
jgi:hypothetical protein